MNKPGLFCLILLIGGFLPHSIAGLPQPEDRDSLMQLLRPGLADSARVDLLSAIHFTWQKENPDSTIHYLHRSTQLAEQIGDHGRQIRGYLNLCNFSWERGHYPEAKAYLQRVKLLLPTGDFPVFEATYAMESAIVRHFTGEMDSSIYFFLQARDAYLVLSDTIGAQKCLTNIGLTYGRLGQHDLAMKYYYETIAYTDGKHSREYQSMRAKALLNITSILIGQDNNEEAIDHARESLEITERLGLHSATGTNHQNLGVAYAKLGLWELSQQHYEQALKKGEQMQGQAQILLAKLGMGQNFVKQDLPSEAIPILRDVLREAEEMDGWIRLSDVHINLSQAYEATEEFEQALFHFREYESLKDSMINADHLDRIATLEVSFQKKEDQQRIAALTTKQGLQQELAEKRALWNWGLGIGMGILAGLLALSIVQYRKRLAREKELAEQQERLTHSQYQARMGELEMKALQAQMNPHFVFNCLNSINHLITQQRGAEASRYLTRFSKLLRMALEYSNEPTISLQEELEMLEMYLQLESLRFKEQFSYSIEIDQEVDPEETYLPSMFMQPFVENAIWHGLLPKEGPGYVKIEVSKAEEYVLCSIEDNGIGRSASSERKVSTIPPHKSMGMDLARERLALISDSTPGKIKIIDLTNDQHSAIGTRVDIQIPAAS